MIKKFILPVVLVMFFAQTAIADGFKIPGIDINKHSKKLKAGDAEIDINKRSKKLKAGKDTKIKTKRGKKDEDECIRLRAGDAKVKKGKMKKGKCKS